MQELIATMTHCWTTLRALALCCALALLTAGCAEPKRKTDEKAKSEPAAEKAAAEEPAAEKPAEPAADKPAEPAAETPAEPAPEKPAEPAPEKPAETAAAETKPAASGKPNTKMSSISHFAGRKRRDARSDRLRQGRRNIRPSR